MNPSLASLREALSIHEQIATLKARLKRILGGGGGDGPYPFLKSSKRGRPRKSTKAEISYDGDNPFAVDESKSKKKRRKMSRAARAKIGAAQKARWAKQKGTAPVAKPGRKRKGLSPEGRARIIAAQKKRWAVGKKN